MAATKFKVGKLYELSLTDLAVDPLQPRKYLDKEALAELTASIRKHNVLQPIIVRKGEQGEKAKFVIVSGERRYRASLAAGRDTIPAILSKGNPLEISLVENLLRENFTAIEEAEAVSTLRKSHNYRLNDLSRSLGKAESTLSEILSLTRLPDSIKDDCRKDPRVSRRALAEIAKEKSPARMLALYGKYKASGLTHGEIRALTRKRPSADGRVDIKFVTNFTKRLHGFNLSRLDLARTELLLSELDTLRLEVNRKLRILKLHPQPETT